MIDLFHENLIPINKVPATVPTKKRLHIATVYRWLSGTRGVRLESVRIGGQRYTSIEALERFFQKLTQAVDAGATPIPDLQIPNAGKQGEKGALSNGRAAAAIAEILGSDLSLGRGPDARGGGR